MKNEPYTVSKKVYDGCFVYLRGSTFCVCRNSKHKIAGVYSKEEQVHGYVLGTNRLSRSSYYIPPMIRTCGVAKVAVKTDNLRGVKCTK